MRVYKSFSTVALLALIVLPGAAGAQFRRFPPAPSDQGVTKRPATNGDTDNSDSRALLGMTLGTSGTDRDTLGLLVTQIVRDGPSDRAGIDEGNRVAEIDGVSLRLDPVDIGRSSASDAIMRRLSRTMRGLQGGEQATLRVFGGGKFRNVMVQIGNATTATSNAPNGSMTISAPPIPSTPTAAVAIAGVSESPARTASVNNALQSLSDLQAQLRKLADDEGSSALADSLMQSARELSAIQRRIRSAQFDQRRRTDDMADRSSSRRGASSSDIPGLSLSPVSDDLADYFGDGSERGLLVLQADPSWSPIRNGDVILSVDGAPVTSSRLREARESRQPVRVELLRRRRQMTVTLNGREE